MPLPEMQRLAMMLGEGGRGFSFRSPGEGNR
jgi:hypothetical protein